MAPGDCAPCPEVEARKALNVWEGDSSEFLLEGVYQNSHHLQAAGLIGSHVTKLVTNKNARAPSTPCQRVPWLASFLPGRRRAES